MLHGNDAWRVCKKTDQRRVHWKHSSPAYRVREPIHECILGVSKPVAVVPHYCAISSPHPRANPKLVLLGTGTTGGQTDQQLQHISVKQLVVDKLPQSSVRTQCSDEKRFDAFSHLSRVKVLVVFAALTREIETKPHLC